MVCPGQILSPGGFQVDRTLENRSAPGMAGDDSTRLTRDDMIRNGRRYENIRRDAAGGAQRGALRQLEDTRRILGTIGISHVIQELKYYFYVNFFRLSLFHSLLLGMVRQFWGVAHMSYGNETAPFDSLMWRFKHVKLASEFLRAVKPMLPQPKASERKGDKPFISGYVSEHLSTFTGTISFLCVACYAYLPPMLSIQLRPSLHNMYLFS
jgi:hypothetical protein